MQQAERERGVDDALPLDADADADAEAATDAEGVAASPDRAGSDPTGAAAAPPVDRPAPPEPVDPPVDPPEPIDAVAVAPRIVRPEGWGPPEPDPDAPVLGPPTPVAPEDVPLGPAPPLPAPPVARLPTAEDPWADVDDDEPEPAPRAPRPGAPSPRRRPAAVTAVHAVTLAAAGAFLLVVNRGQWFQSDDFDFLANRGVLGDPQLGLFAPHNEHWSTLPILAYRGLFWLFGMTTHLPYVVLLVAVHLAVAHLLWRVARRAGAEPWTATGLAAGFAVLGAGWENLLWAFQVTFLSSIAFGLAAALVVTRHRRRRLGWGDLGGALLSVAALACSGVGVTMVAAVGLAALLRRGVRAALVAWLVPGAAFAVWLALAGRTGIEGAAVGEATLVALPAYVATGVAGAVDAVVGLPYAGVVLVAGLLVWAALLLHRDRRRVATPVALAVAPALFFAIVGIGRIDVSTDPTSSRYVYVAAALLLPAVASAVGLVAGVLPRWIRPVLGVALGAALVVPGVLEISRQSVPYAEAEQRWRDRIVAAAELAATEPRIVLEPAVTQDLDAAELVRMREEGRLPPLTADVDPERVAEARTLLGVAAAPVEPGAEPPDPSIPLVTATDISALPGDPGCLVASPDGDAPAVTLRVPRRGTLVVTSEAGTTLAPIVDDGELAVARPRGFELEAGVPAELRFAEAADVTLPLPAEAGTLTVCGVGGAA